MRIIPNMRVRTILIVLLRAARIPTTPVIAAAAVALLLAACGSGSTTSAGDGLRIVVTTDVLGDVVAEVAGSGVEVVTLMPEGADPHSFEPSARQIAMVEDADLVVANGLGLESGLAPALEQAADGGVPVLELAPLVDPIPFGARGEEHQSSDEPNGTEADPHFWLDPVRVARAAEILGDRLGEIEPGGGWETRASEEAEDLRALDAEVDQILSGLPAEERLLATDHDAFGYFADRYGFEIVGVVVPGGSTLAEPSASDLDALVRELEDSGIPAIFVGSTAPDALAQAVAREVSGQVDVVELGTGSLGDGTYRSLILTNAQRIADALARSPESPAGGSS